MFLRALAALAVLLLVSCGSTKLPLPSMPGLSPYRIEIQQGNFISQEMVSLLKPGMSKDQVRFILGTALITDSFHGDRWDYVFRRQKANSNQLEQSKLAVFFEGGRLARVESDVIPVASADVAAVKMPEAKAAATKPETSAAKPETPVAKSEAPAPKPQAPEPKPAVPVAKPEALGRKPQAPAPKPEAPGAKPEAAAPKPVAPVAKPQAPAPKPEAPLAKEAPAPKPQAPAPKPEAPLAKEAPAPKPQAPAPKPEAPAPKKPEAPALEAPMLAREAPAATPEAYRRPASGAVLESPTATPVPPADQASPEKSWWERLKDKVKS